MANKTSEHTYLNDILEKSPIIQLYEDFDKIKCVELADRYLKHEFNLLGSGWIKNRYGMIAAGFEGSNHSDPEVTFDKALKKLPFQFRNQAEKLIELAKNIIEGYEPLDWHIDFKSGCRYETEYYRDLKYGIVEGLDAKVPYDLSRCCHLVILARAWRITGDEFYRREAMAQILDWIAMNPYEYGIGWNANMNVGIRLANLVIAFSLIRDSYTDKMSLEEKLFINVLQDSFLQHRRFISANLEFAETSIHPNHYLGDLGGLLIGSVFVKRWDADSEAWYRLALREIGLELDRQIGNDGFDYESATSYHAFGLEMLIYPLLIAAKASGCNTTSDILTWIKQQIGEQRVKKIGNMFVSLAAIIQPDGLIPLIGDADSGRFLLLEALEHEDRDRRFLLGIGDALYNDLLLPAGILDESYYSAANMLFEKPEAARISGPALKSSAFQDAGYYILRSPEIFCFIFCGPIGTNGLGGHSHDDKLSLTLCIRGLEIIVDPGIYVYTASRRFRDAYRSTRAHNTVCVDGQPQNRFLEDSPWWGCYEDTCCECIQWEDTENYTVFAGQHSGYLRLPSGVLHRRRIELKKRDNRMTITDEFIPNGTVPSIPGMLFSFNLHPDCNVEYISEDTAVVKRAALEVHLTAPDSKWEIEEGFFSPAYGIKQKAIRLVIFKNTGVLSNTIELTWN